MRERHESDRRDAFFLRMLTLMGVLGLVVACGADRGPGAMSLEVSVDTLGDTVVVRTLSGSGRRDAELILEFRVGTVEGPEHEMFGDIWGLAVHPTGDIYVYDRSVPALRRYARDGTFLGTIGRRGGGPGEYENADIGGLTVLTNGRLLLRDPGNGRFTVYSSEGEYLESWRGLSGVFTSVPVVSASDGGFFHHPFAPLASSTVVIRFDSAGHAIDTISVPLPEVDLPTLTARREGGPFGSREVPFSPTALWTINGDGEVFTARSDRYEIERHRIDGSILRIARDLEPVPLSAAERTAARERATEAMRSIDPNWQWNAPPVPSQKPFLRQLYLGVDGRLWVLLHQPSEMVPGEEGNGRPPRFEERVVFDIFERDGRYLGQVRAPEGFSLTPRPIFGSEHVWAVVRDDLDIPQIARFRLLAHD